MAGRSDLAWFERHRLRLVAAFCLPVGVGSVPYHRHVHLEVVLHRAGRGRGSLPDGGGYDFAPGDCTLYPPGVDHEQRNHEVGEDLCLHLAVPPGAPAILRRAHQARADADLRAELESLAEPAPAGRLQQLARDLRATAAVLRLLDADPSGLDAGDPGHAANAARYLAEHLASVRRFDEVARHLGIGTDRLRHLFSAAHGCGMARYLMRLRAERARELLADGAEDLAAVAAACGFATTRYLCTVFRAEIGCTPGEWRRRSAAERRRIRRRP